MTTPQPPMEYLTDVAAPLVVVAGADAVPVEVIFATVVRDVTERVPLTVAVRTSVVGTVITVDVGTVVVETEVVLEVIVVSVPELEDVGFDKDEETEDAVEVGEVGEAAEVDEVDDEPP